MESNYYIVQLVNGTCLVGDLEYTVDSIVLKFPLAVTAKAISNSEGSVIGEHMVLRPYLVMTDDREVVIDQFNVLCASTLSTRLHQSYEDMLETVYGKPVSFDGDFYSPDEPEVLEKMSKEEAVKMKEQVDALLDDMDDSNIH